MATTTTRERCAARTGDYGSCSNPGKFHEPRARDAMMHDAPKLWWCGVHAPSVKAEKHEVRQAQRKVEAESRARTRTGRNSRNNALDTLLRIVRDGGIAHTLPADQQEAFDLYVERGAYVGSNYPLHSERS